MIHVTTTPYKTIDGINVYDDINAAMKSGATLSTKPIHRAIASMICIVARGEKIPYGAQKDDLEGVMRKTYDIMVETAVNNAKTNMTENDVTSCYVVVEKQQNVMATSPVFGSIMSGNGGFYGGTLDGIASRVEFEKGGDADEDGVHRSSLRAKAVIFSSVCFFSF